MNDDSGALARGVAGYIRALEHESPIVSTSHYYLRGLYEYYGKNRVDQAVDLYFETLKEQGQ